MLSRSDLDPDPLRQFGRWYQEAERAGFIEPTAMVLATVDAEARPSARVVLLKGWDERGFVFFTHYDSRKGRELAVHPRAALLFWWDRLGWQVRLEGEVEVVSGAESDAYFAGRARESQVAAHASPQSRPIAGRAELEERFAAVAGRFAEHAVPRPERWGGYRLRPERCEFWSQGPNRLHDRFEYERGADGGWRVVRLAP
jgi:pyridoxamine 5'-phosphate oxidase